MGLGHRAHLPKGVHWAVARFCGEGGDVHGPRPRGGHAGRVAASPSRPRQPEALSKQKREGAYGAPPGWCPMWPTHRKTTRML